MKVNILANGKLQMAPDPFIVRGRFDDDDQQQS